ncbi:dual specificity protein phosphatase [Leptolyngbya sp. FACHB-16]
MSPSIAEQRSLYMLEFFGASVVLSSAYPVEHLKVQLWTNALSKFNSEGDWHGIDLAYQRQDANGNLVFEGGFRPTSEGDYAFTYRVASNVDPEWQWAGEYGQDGQLHVKLPSPRGDHWTQGAHYVEIYPHVYVGNFIAASQAEELGIDAILNLASELTLSHPIESGIAYRKMGTLDGAQHPISDDILLASVQWIEEQLQTGKQKILVHCRAGIGRSGSVGIAYCFSKHPDWNYDQTLQYIWSKKANIYPHRNLQDSLERLFPRH